MDAPDYPDPQQTAQSQAQANLGTGMSQQLLNMINQNTPYGSLSYRPTGTYEYRDPLTGKMVTIPQFTANTQLTPEQQKLLNQQQRFGTMTNRIGIQQAGRIGDLLGRPVNLNNPAVEKRLMELGRKRLDPMWNQREEQLRQQLQNRGIAEGSEAWKRAYTPVMQGRNDAYNQLLLQGRGQAINEMLTERNQPINETSALMAGGQVSQPNFVSTPSTGLQGVDYTGLQQGQYNARNQNYQGMLGGMFGLGSAALGGWAMSDERTKKYKKPIGKLNDGTKLYSFKYRKAHGGGMFQLGVMAQEIEKKHRKAVMTGPDGYKRVDYERLAKDARAA